MAYSRSDTAENIIHELKVVNRIKDWELKILKIQWEESLVISLMELSGKSRERSNIWLDNSGDHSTTVKTTNNWLKGCESTESRKIHTEADQNKTKIRLKIR